MAFLNLYIWFYRWRLMCNTHSLTFHRIDNVFLIPSAPFCVNFQIWIIVPELFFLDETFSLCRARARANIQGETAIVKRLWRAVFQGIGKERWLNTSWFSAYGYSTAQSIHIQRFSFETHSFEKDHLLLILQKNTHCNVFSSYMCLHKELLSTFPEFPVNAIFSHLYSFISFHKWKTFP